MVDLLADGSTYGFKNGGQRSMNRRVISINIMNLTISLVNSGSRAVDPTNKHQKQEVWLIVNALTNRQANKNAVDDSREYP